MLGAPIGLFNNKHVAIDMLIKKAPQKAQSLINVINILLIVFISVIYLYYGWKFSMKGMRRIVPSLDWIKFWLCISVITYRIWTYVAYLYSTII